MMFSFTPIVVQVWSPSVESISTRVTAPVPFCRVEHPHLVVGEVHTLERREAAVERGAQRAVERVHRTVAFGGRDHPLAAAEHLHRRFGRDGGTGLVGERRDPGAVVGDHAERLHVEPVGLPTGRAPHEQLERAVGDLEVVALVLESLELLDDLGELRTVELETELLRLEHERRLARRAPTRRSACRCRPRRATGARTRRDAWRSRSCAGPPCARTRSAPRTRPAG